MNTAVEPPTRAFREICQIEPRLFGLWMQVSTIKPYPEGGFCANRLWVAHFKPELERLVGWQAENPVLQTELDYDIAYISIYYAMPECDHCGMCW